MMPLTISSPAFAAGASIPTKHTCEGADTSPALVWSGVPDGTKSLALIVDDPDAPDPAKPKMVYVHWVLYNLDAKSGGLPEDAGAAPLGGRDGTNDWNRTGYGGPCPPIGRHRYFFKLYALDSVLPDLGNPTKSQLLDTMKGHILEQAEIIGTYQKSGRSC